VPLVVRAIQPRAISLAAAVAFVVINLVVPSGAPAPVDPVAPAALDEWFDDAVRDAGIPGAAIAVVEDGRIVHEHGTGVADDSGRPVTARTPFVIGSLAKSLTALAVGQLVERGLVDLDAPVRQYVPDFAVADAAASDAITVRQLLNQTSGIPGAAGTDPLSSPATTLDDQVHALRTVALAAAPGAAFAYSNANYVVLGRLVELVSGESYEAYLQGHVARPLGMVDTTSVAATARADGLGQAHRLWFGVADAHAPLFREDLAPAGFVASSADDLARVLAAELDGGRYGPVQIAAPATIDALWNGVAPAGPSGRYAMGWFDGTLDGERLVAHAGSTTDMASFQAVVPARGLGVVVLFNAQSVLYEALHKPDSIGLAAVAKLMGREAPGTLALFYPAFDLIVVLIVGLLIRNLLRFVRTPIAPRSRPWPQTWRGRVMLPVRLYLDVVVPVAILVEAPAVLGAGWAVLVRIDLGLVLAVIAALRLLDGVVRTARTIRGMQLTGATGPEQAARARVGGTLATER
jgi:CubicO group peptidase (beta-lactamase class C family)